MEEWKEKDGCLNKTLSAQCEGEKAGVGKRDNMAFDSACYHYVLLNSFHCPCWVSVSQDDG